jgi:hypothetical protein
LKVRRGSELKSKETEEEDDCLAQNEQLDDELTTSTMHRAKSNFIDNFQVFKKDAGDFL